MRPDTTIEGLGKLRTAFDGIGAMGGFDDVALQKYHWLERINHVHTGGNSSGIVDGAALLLIGNEGRRQVAGVDPRARIVGHRHQRRRRHHHADRPTPATEGARACRSDGRPDRPVRTQRGLRPVVLKFQKDLKIPDEKLNVNGGAIAMGHRWAPPAP